MRMCPSLLAALCALLVHAAGHALGALGAQRIPALAHSSVSKSLLGRCTRKSFKTDLDHFSRSKGPDGQQHFDMRYFVCDDKHRAATSDKPPGPIFFYLGNESDVLLYLNATGLMWENAERFGAMLIFAEHRYYGESLPFGKDTYSHMEWLSSEQALADYATLLFDFKRRNKLEDAPVIGFGGSYGGMLATWARIKYPHVWQGAIAGSAPILTFEGERPPVDPLFYSKTVTFDTTPAAGAPDGCTDALRSAFVVLTGLIDAEDAARNDGKVQRTSDRGFKTASDSLRICPSVKLNSTDDVTGVRDWAAAAFDMMAMGQYPYPSSYMLNGNGVLPAFPVRVACSKMLGALREAAGVQDAQRDVATTEALRTALPGSARRDRARGAERKLLGDIEDMPDEQHVAHSPKALLEGLAEAVGVWYNYTGTEECFNPWQGVNKETALVGDLWDYQYCTEMFMPMAKSGKKDIYWSEPWDDAAARQACESAWGLQPRATWGTVVYGGRALSTLTNVVFTNGLYDPWHLGGVLHDLSDTVKALIIPEGGHHLDLFFSNPEDPPSVTRVRKEQMRNVAQWIRQYHEERHAQQVAGGR